jgi:hypothetical protein
MAIRRQVGISELIQERGANRHGQGARILGMLMGVAGIANVSGMQIASLTVSEERATSHRSEQTSVCKHCAGRR